MNPAFLPPDRQGLTGVEAEIVEGAIATRWRKPSTCEPGGRELLLLPLPRGVPQTQFKSNSALRAGIHRSLGMEKRRKETPEWLLEQQVIRNRINAPSIVPLEAVVVTEPASVKVALVGGTRVSNFAQTAAGNGRRLGALSGGDNVEGWGSGNMPRKRWVGLNLKPKKRSRPTSTLRLHGRKLRCRASTFLASTTVLQSAELCKGASVGGLVRQHGYHDTCDHHHRPADSFRWRLVRPGTLVLGRSKSVKGLPR